MLEQTGTTIEKGWLFQFWLLVLVPLAHWFWRFDVTGIENIPKNTPAVYIGHHTTHSGDIHIGLLVLYSITGKVIRGLLHRTVIFFFPIFRKLGSVAGHRKSALELLKNGESVGCIPGGGEELCLGHENAYKLCWKSSSGNKRSGFAYVADAAKVPVIPLAGRNSEEMYFCLPAYVWNQLGLSKWFDQYIMTLPGVLGWLANQLRTMSTLTVHSHLSIPLPVNAGIVIGKPLWRREHESVENFACRCENAFQKLLYQVNGRKGTNYSAAVKERFKRKTE